ncbi:MAG: hypothetical protein NTV43_00240 [Methylococcales bacterium]|nr:hypothetical protein [Methylococcales bacterium]
MDKAKTAEQLKTLAQEADGRSESARLGDIIGEVESALKAGAKRQAVLNTLHQHYGFKMSMSGFEKALKRYRKNNHGKATDTATGFNPSAIVKKPTETGPDNKPINFISPGDIKKQRVKGMEDAMRIEEEINNINYGEINQ